MDKYKDIINIKNVDSNIDDLVIEIMQELKIMHNLYKVLLKEITGCAVDIFDKSVKYKKILKLDGLKFEVKPHGFGYSFFLTYEKPRFLWFKDKKHFYFAKGYTFYDEYDSTTRYDFNSNDYIFILNVLKKENVYLKSEIESVKESKKLGKDI